MQYVIHRVVVTCFDSYSVPASLCPFSNKLVSNHPLDISPPPHHSDGVVFLMRFPSYPMRVYCVPKVVSPRRDTFIRQ